MLLLLFLSLWRRTSVAAAHLPARHRDSLPLRHGTTAPCLLQSAMVDETPRLPLTRLCLRCDGAFSVCLRAGAHPAVLPRATPWRVAAVALPRHPVCPPRAAAQRECRASQPRARRVRGRAAAPRPMSECHRRTLVRQGAVVHLYVPRSSDGRLHLNPLDNALISRRLFLGEPSTFRAHCRTESESTHFQLALEFSSVGDSALSARLIARHDPSALSIGSGRNFPSQRLQFLEMVSSP